MHPYMLPCVAGMVAYQIQLVFPSDIRHEDFRSFVHPSVTLIPPPLDSETGWTGEL